MLFSQNVRAAMAARKISVEQLAEATGLSKYTIIKARRDGTHLSFDTARKIAAACGFSLDSVTL